jgi:hypothetical protein
VDLLNWLCQYEERHHDGGSGSGVRVLRAPDTMEGPLAPALLHAVGLPSTSLWLLWDPNSLACSLPVVAAFPNAGVRLVRLGGQVAFAALLCFAFAFIALRLLFFVAAGPLQVCRTLGRSTTTVSLGRDIYARLCASLGDDGCTTLSTAAVSLPLPVLL